MDGHTIVYYALLKPRAADGACRRSYGWPASPPPPPPRQLALFRFSASRHCAHLQRPDTQPMVMACVSTAPWPGVRFTAHLQVAALPQPAGSAAAGGTDVRAGRC